MKRELGKISGFQLSRSLRRVSRTVTVGGILGFQLRSTVILKTTKFYTVKLFSSSNVKEERIEWTHRL